MSTLTQRPIADGLFTWPDPDPQLLGGRCTACGVHTFPHQDGCPRCSGTSLEPVGLAREGSLWTWTTQGFRPKSPPYTGPDDSFLLGYVALPGQLRIETRLVGVSQERLHIGMPMHLVIVPFRTDGDTEIMTFAFTP